jgi:hypothetical protein
MVKKTKSLAGKVMSVFRLASRRPNAKEKSFKIIEDAYPRIHKMITVCWGSEELQQKLTNMMQYDNAQREGFPMHVMEALMIIQEIHMEEFGFEPAASTFLDSDQYDRW